MYNLDRLLESAIAVVRWIAKGMVFRIMISRAQPENESPPTDFVDGIRHVGEQCWIAKSRADHQGPYFHAGGGSCQSREH
jgi:hypothetical protein